MRSSHTHTYTYTRTHTMFIPVFKLGRLLSLFVCQHFLHSSRFAFRREEDDWRRRNDRKKYFGGIFDIRKKYNKILSISGASLLMFVCVCVIINYWVYFRVMTSSWSNAVVGKRERVRFNSRIKCHPF